MNFKDEFLRHLKVAVWGTGYLGYTSILKLQSLGIRALLHDFKEDGLELIRQRNYPSAVQVSSWSRRNQIVALDFDKLEVAQTPESMLQSDIQVHLIAMPAKYLNQHSNENLKKLASVFQTCASTHSRPLVLFLSASGPGSIRRDFLSGLGDKADSYHVATAFRGDWSIEDFVGQKKPLLVSAIDTEALQKAKIFLDILGEKTTKVDQVEEAELLENAANALEFTITAYLNQLSVAFPKINMRKITSDIFERCAQMKPQLGIGSGGYRFPVSVENLIQESPYAQTLSILREAGNVNFSSILSYCDYLERKNYRKVLILGMAVQNDLYQSPSLILAESLIRRKIKVFLHDPTLDTIGRQFVMDGLEYFDLQKDSTETMEAILLNLHHPAYELISQTFIDQHINGHIRLVIDSCGVWSGYRFGDGTFYHQIGDGRLDLMD